MQALRYYIDKKIVDGVGGDHSRTIDVPELDPHVAGNTVAAMLEPDEVIGQCALIEVYDDAAAEQLVGGEAVSHGR